MNTWVVSKYQYDLVHRLGYAKNGIYKMPYKTVELVIAGVLKQE
jgi:hypothetical protein